MEHQRNISTRRFASDLAGHRSGFQKSRGRQAPIRWRERAVVRSLQAGSDYWPSRVFGHRNVRSARVVSRALPTVSRCRVQCLDENEGFALDKGDDLVVGAHQRTHVAEDVTAHRRWNGDREALLLEVVPDGDGGVNPAASGVKCLTDWLVRFMVALGAAKVSSMHVRTIV